MLACPHCRTRLTKQPSPAGPRWHCGACGGRAVHLPSLRCTPAGSFVRRLWALARSAPWNEHRRPCPICGDLMPVVPSIAAPGSSEPLQLDVCVSCQFVWFDPTEHEAWVRASWVAATADRLPAETLAALARLPQPPPPPHALEPDEPASWGQLSPKGEFEWKYLICILGLPVEIEPPPLHRRPWVTWTVATLVTMVSLAAAAMDAQAVSAWAFIPAEMWRHGGSTLITSFFLHGSWWHLVANMYLLVILGDNVEDLLGGARYLALLLVGAVAGNLLHAAVDPSAQIPAIGASGGIAAVILYYGLLFPHGRLRLFRFMLVDLSVWVALVLWVVVQLAGTFVQASYGTEVSYAAHVGGALAGLTFWSVNGRGEIARG